MKIYVAGKENDNFAKEAYLFPRQIIYMSSTNKKLLTDTTNDNISDKNNMYSEMTAEYWVWKNSTEDIIGFEHYRRYFSNTDQILTDKQILEILSNNDIILHKTPQGNNTGYTCMKNAGKGEEFKKCIAVVKYLYPEYYNDIQTYINQHYVYEGNMFICKKELIDEYFKWVFDIVFTYENCASKEIYKNLNLTRLCGYLTEYLFGAWVEHNKLKISNQNRLIFSKDFKNKWIEY